MDLNPDAESTDLIAANFGTGLGLEHVFSEVNIDSLVILTGELDSFQMKLKHFVSEQTQIQNPGLLKKRH